MYTGGMQRGGREGGEEPYSNQLSFPGGFLNLKSEHVLDGVHSVSVDACAQLSWCFRKCVKMQPRRFSVTNKLGCGHFLSMFCVTVLISHSLDWDAMISQQCQHGSMEKTLWCQNEMKQC